MDVRSFFDGRTAVELRLWDALGRRPSCPFHYFAVADGTDLRAVSWSRGRYDEAQLSNIFTGNDARVRIVLSELRDKVADVGGDAGLGFCVSVAHAEYMARQVRRSRHSGSGLQRWDAAHERAATLDDLRARRINAVFAVDVLNEGLDIPDVDTILMLRPTESATIFLQQLGRGLRRTPTKAVLTVLDFIGYHRKEFSFAQRYRALTGDSRRGLERQVEEGFPFLPSGCQIVLDKQAQNLVLENIRSQIANRWQQIVAGASRPSGPRHLAGGIPQGLRNRAQRHPAAREPLLDAAPPRRRPARPPGSDLEESCSSASAPSRTSTILSARMPTTAFCATATSTTTHCRPTSSASLGCSSTRCGPMAEALRRTATDSRPLETRRPRGRKSRKSSTLPTRRAAHVPIGLEGHSR